MDNWSTEYKQRIVNDLNEAQDAVKETRKSLEARRKLNGELQEANTLLRRRNNVLTSDLEALIERYNAIERLLEALTPGGSEFAGDPARCAEWVRERLASTGGLAAERNRLLAAAEALATALEAIYDGINDEYHPAFREDLLTDQDRTLLVNARVALRQYREAQDG